ncbi:conserved exported protein of unknown function [Hyphomicrobium sp. 1Nfss2.1]|uniref:hypothetical protein n=1 Tax=Hyphomicrobium sp. 1Nfss2.1 TaxID=3413936 RepID=UPI003C7C5B3C
MNKLLTLSAALMVFGSFSMSSALAWCDEDCVIEAHEAAYERAAAREEAEEEGYVIEPQTRQRPRRGEPRQIEQTYARNRPSPAKRDDEPPVTRQPADSRSQTRATAKIENSSIATSGTRLAEGDDYRSEPAHREVGCKTFFPTVGMTLSVPCD